MAAQSPAKASNPRKAGRGHAAPKDTRAEAAVAHGNTRTAKSASRRRARASAAGAVEQPPILDTRAKARALARSKAIELAAADALAASRVMGAVGSSCALVPTALDVEPSPERTAALWQAYFAEPVDAARNLLVEAYQGLVRDIVRRFAARLPRNVDRGDLLTAANFGLISAIGSFDPGRGVRFEAYGERRIKGALLDELRTQDWLPRPWRQRIEQHKRALERLRSDHGRTPLDGEVAAALQLPLEEYQLRFGTGLPGAPSGSMSLSESGEEIGGGLDVVPDPKGDEPAERLTRDELLALVSSRLNDQEYRIVHLYYWEELPMREIGQLTGLSESRICKIHMQLIDRLKARLRSHAAES